MFFFEMLIKDCALRMYSHVKIKIILILFFVFNLFHHRIFSLITKYAIYGQWCQSRFVLVSAKLPMIN